jgi:membrane dipeptidase
MPDSLARARDLLRRVPLVDGHNDLPWAMLLAANYDLDAIDLAVRGTATQTDLVRLREGGIGAQFWSVYVDGKLQGEHAVTATLEQIDFVYELVARFPEHLAFARTADEIESVFEQGRIASLMGAEGGHSIDCSLAALRQLYALGTRYLTLTHNDPVPWADTNAAPSVVGGLSRFGREVVAEMNRLGMLVDLSHTAPETMHAALDATVAPLIFSHSSCRALVNHTRNVPDDVLVRLAANGGVCMVAFVPYFVGDGPDATIGNVADHVEYARGVAGIDCIGIGADYDGCDVFPPGLEDVSGYPRLFAELYDRGWNDDELAALAGGNVIRALRGAEDVAARLQKERPPSHARIEDLDG